MEPFPRGSYVRQPGRPVLEVISDDGQTLEACPIGGGFLRTFRAADRAAFVPAAFDPYGPDMVLRLATFSEWYPDAPLVGYLVGIGHNGTHRWNGWAAPRMTAAQCNRWIATAAAARAAGGACLMVPFWKTVDNVDLLCVDFNDESGSHDAYDPEMVSSVSPEWCEDLGEHVYDVSLGLTWDEDEAPQIGRRIVLRSDVERYPHFIAKQGSTGRVSRVVESKHWDATRRRGQGGYIVTYLIEVTMDAPLPNAEAWDNAVQWSEEETYDDGMVLDAVECFRRDCDQIDDTDSKEA